MHSSTVPVAREGALRSPRIEWNFDQNSDQNKGDQVIREDPAGAVVVRAWPGHRNIGRGSCRSALADGVERRSTAVVRGLSVYSRRRPNGSLRPVNRSPPLHPPLQSASEGIGGARGLGNLVRPESHPEPRGFPVQWADPGVKLAHFSPVSPFGPALVPV